MAGTYTELATQVMYLDADVLEASKLADVLHHWGGCAASPAGFGVHLNHTLAILGNDGVHDGGTVVPGHIEEGFHSLQQG